MSDVELLFLVLALIYIWECANWVPLGAKAFTTWLGTRWRYSSPALRNQKGGFVLAPPLPPLGGILSVNPSPLFIAPQGILAVRPASRRGGENLVVGWDEIRKIDTEGKTLVINGKAFARGFSATQARRTADQLRELLKFSASARESALQKSMQERFRIKIARRQWKAFSLRTANLQFLANALFVYLFVFAPLAISRMGLALIWPSLLAGLYALTFSISFIFHHTHKHFYPTMKDDRFTHTLINMFSPATTIRARDVLSRPLLENFHPVAVANAFCPEPEFRQIAQAAVLDFRFPPKSTKSDRSVAAEAIVRYCSDLEKKALESFLQQHGVKVDELLQAPERMDETCVSYCPRCQAQFTFADGQCSDCGGIRLVPFPAAAGKKPAPAGAR
jgi:hypothetical protein